MSKIRHDIARAIVAMCRSVDDYLVGRNGDEIEVDVENHFGGGNNRARIDIYMNTVADDPIEGVDSTGVPSVASLVMEMLSSNPSSKDFGRMQSIDCMTEADVQAMTRTQSEELVTSVRKDANHISDINGDGITANFVTDDNGDEVLIEIEVGASFEPFATIEGHEVSIRTSPSPHMVAFTPDDFRVTKDGVDVNVGEFIHALVMPGITYLPAGRKIFTLSHDSHSYHFLSSRGHFVAVRTGPQALFWEQLVFASIDRLRTVNGECPSEYNLSAIGHLDQAIHAADQRQKDRLERNVLGTQQP